MAPANRPDPEPFRLTFGEESGPLMLEQAFEQTRMAMCVTDPHEDDNPIVYANRAFLNLVGYDEDEVIGYNCRFMQGPDTDPAAVQKLRDALASEDVCIVELLNYRKNGDAFWNALHIGPIYDEHGRLRYFFGSQWDVTNIYAGRAREAEGHAVNRELHHRIKNLFAVVSSIVSLSARQADSPAEVADRARDRIAALGRAHDSTIDPDRRQAGASTRTLVDDIIRPFGRDGDDAVRIEGEDVSLDYSVVTPLGLALHEMTTNSVKYGRLGGHSDALDVGWTHDDRGFHLTWRERFPRPPTDAGVGVGSRIMSSLVASVGGTFEMGVEGTDHVTRLSLPNSVIVADGFAQDGVSDSHVHNPLPAQATRERSERT